MVTISVGELFFGEPGDERTYEVDLPLFEDKEIRLINGQKVLLKAYRNKGGVSVNPLKQAVKAKVFCTKCLEEFTLEIELYPTERQYYRGTPDSVEEFEEFEYVTPNFDIDVEYLLREAIFLNLPPAIVCKEDCKGLCLKCGKDLNKGDCRCAKDGVETIKPFEALKDIIQD
jgi:uncharacterized protein